MAAQRHIATVPNTAGLSLTRVGLFQGLRALAWCGNDLYGSRGYELVRARVSDGDIVWSPVAQYQPEWWRRLTSSSRLAFRLVRDGFHALAVLSAGHIVAAVPGAIVTLPPEEKQFQVSHRVLRGTR